MATSCFSLSPPTKPIFPSPSKHHRLALIHGTHIKKHVSCGLSPTRKALVGSLIGLGGLGLISTGHASASDLQQLLGSSLSMEFSEPATALSLPTWAIHVSSVVEWILAMALVWQYAEQSGFESWKGLSWGMVPLLGGALCACTWHFFYNAESLEVLVALQAALTVIGNATMCIAAFRIYKASQERSENL